MLDRAMRRRKVRALNKTFCFSGDRHRGQKPPSFRIDPLRVDPSTWRARTGSNCDGRVPFHGFCGNKRVPTQNTSKCLAPVFLKALQARLGSVSSRNQEHCHYFVVLQTDKGGALPDPVLGHRPEGDVCRSNMHCSWHLPNHPGPEDHVMDHVW